jgi:hypothetical protein
MMYLLGPNILATTVNKLGYWTFLWISNNCDVCCDLLKTELNLKKYGEITQMVPIPKGVVSIDPLVITVGPDQLKYGTQPEGAMISRCEDRDGSLQVLSLESHPLTRSPAEKELAAPNLSLTDDELVTCGRDGYKMNIFVFNSFYDVTVYGWGSVS